MIRILASAAIVSAGLAGLAVPSQAQAQFFITGSQLAKACASHATRDESACDGYIAGALDVVQATPDLKAQICPPAKVKLSTLREAVGNYGQRKPDDAKGSGIALIQAMLKANYPCQK